MEIKIEVDPKGFRATMFSEAWHVTATAKTRDEAVTKLVNKVNKQIDKVARGIKARQKAQ